MGEDFVFEHDIANEQELPRNQIALQLKIGMVGILLLIISSVVNNYYMSYIGFPGDELTFISLYIVGTFIALSGSAFLVAGNIGILKKNGSNLAWIFAATYIIGWIWQFAFSYAIAPWIMDMELVGPSISLSTVIYLYTYSLIVISLIAWWSIHSEVSDRAIYHMYLGFYALGGLLGYFATGFLFGFGGITVHAPIESFIYRTPSMLISIATYIVLFLFYRSEKIDEASTKYEYQYNQ